MRVGAAGLDQGVVLAIKDLYADTPASFLIAPTTP